LYLSPSINKQIKSRRMRRAGHVARMRKRKGKRPLGRPKRRWDKNGSWEDWLGECRVDPVGSGYGPVAGCWKLVMKPRVLAPRS
jgi:hypothetical protein